MKRKKINSPNNMAMLAPSVILMALFQICFLFFVNCINGADSEGYTSVAVAAMAVGVAVIAFIAKYDGDFINAFIFTILTMFGFALQATLNELKNDIIFIVASVFVSLFAFVAFDLFVNKKFIKGKEKMLYILFLALTVAVLLILLLFGNDSDTGTGVKAWLNVGFANIQLTEFTKPLFIIIMTVLLGNKELSDKTKITMSTAALGVIGALMLIIGELGTLLVMGFVYIILLVLFIQDRSLLIKFFTVCILAFACLLVLVPGSIKVLNKLGIEWGILSKIQGKFNVVFGRWDAFVNPEDHASGQAFQVLSAQKAIAEGGVFGSTTNFTVFSFEADCIYPYLIMRLGFLVGFAVLAAFIIFYNRSLKSIMEKEKDINKCVFYMGMLLSLILQMMIIAFGSVNFIPLTGIPLPLLSNGGSSMIINFPFFWLLLRQSCREKAGVFEIAGSIKNYDFRTLKALIGKGKQPRNIIRIDDEEEDNKSTEAETEASEEKENSVAEADSQVTEAETEDTEAKAQYAETVNADEEDVIQITEAESVVAEAEVAETQVTSEMNEDGQQNEEKEE